MRNAGFAWLWHGRSIWSGLYPICFRDNFFGSNAYLNQLLRTSWAGVAVTVAIYGLLGGGGGLYLAGRAASGGWSLYGAVAGLAVYFLFYDFIWRHVDPLVTLYAPDRQLEVGHVLWGIVLARSPLYARRISQVEASAGPTAEGPHSEGPETAQMSDVHDKDVPEVRSGEVML